MSLDSNFKILSTTGVAGKSGFEWNLVGKECAAALSLGNLNAALEIQTIGT